MTQTAEQMLAETAWAARKWGLRAAIHGLVIIEADRDSILVSDPAFEDAHGFRIKQIVLQNVRDIDWPFQEAARRIAARHGVVLTRAT